MGLSTLSYPKCQSELFIPFPQRIYYLKTYINRTLNQVSDDGIQRILLLRYRFCGWFTSSYCFCLVLQWKRRTPMWADVDTSESPLIIIYLASFSIRSIFLSFNSQQRYRDHQLIRYRRLQPFTTSAAAISDSLPKEGVPSNSSNTPSAVLRT